MRKSPINNLPLKAILFVRVSRETQEQGSSLDAQAKSIYDYCSEKKLEIIKEFSITESSTRGDRKQYHEMLDFVKSRPEKIAIVVNCVDRLQRNYKDTPALDELRKLGKIEVHFLKEHLILHRDSSGMDIMFWNMSVLMANSYVLSLSDNVKRSMHYNQAHGIWQSRAPIGLLNYRDELGESHIKIDPVRGPLVQKLFAEYAKGLYSVKELTHLAKEIGLLSDVGKKKHRPPHSLHISGVYWMLQNYFYCGFMYNLDGQLIPHKHDVLIDKNTFDKCQEFLHGKNRPQFKYAAKTFIFRGLMKCAECGHAITSMEVPNRYGTRYIYLSCANHKTKCPQKNVRESAVLEQLENELFKRLSFPESLLAAMTSELQKRMLSERSSRTDSKKSLEEQLTALNHKQSELTDLLLAKSIKQNIFDMKSTELTGQIQEIESKLKNCSNSDSGAALSVETLISLASRAYELFKTAGIAKKREILNLLCSNLVLDNKKVLISAKKPFDFLLKQHDYPVWSG